MTKAAITGIGLSKIGRNTGRPAMAHLLEAARKALECAGLTRDDIKEVILQAAIYSGVPKANHATKEAEAVFADMGQSPKAITSA